MCLNANEKISSVKLLNLVVPYVFRCKIIFGLRFLSIALAFLDYLSILL
jgi:hypothetical protein